MSFLLCLENKLIKKPFFFFLSVLMHVMLDLFSFLSYLDLIGSYVALQLVTSFKNSSGKTIHQWPGSRQPRDSRVHNWREAITSKNVHKAWRVTSAWTSHQTYYVPWTTQKWLPPDPPPSILNFIPAPFKALFGVIKNCNGHRKVVNTVTVSA